MKVASPRVESAQAGVRTLRNRTVEVGSHRNLSSGGSIGVQLTDEIKVLSNEERKQLLSSGVFSQPTMISAKGALALKADLVIPWNKLRVMRRYTILRARSHSVGIHHLTETNTV